MYSPVRIDKQRGFGKKGVASIAERISRIQLNYGFIDTNLFLDSFAAQCSHASQHVNMVLKKASACPPAPRLNDTRCLLTGGDLCLHLWWTWVLLPFSAWCVAHFYPHCS